MMEDKQTIIKMIEQLKLRGIKDEEIAYKFGVSKQTITNYRNGKIPQSKCALFILFVKNNYQEVYELCI